MEPPRGTDLKEEEGKGWMCLPRERALMARLSAKDREWLRILGEDTLYY